MRGTPVGVATGEAGVGPPSTAVRLPARIAEVATSAAVRDPRAIRSTFSLSEWRLTGTDQGEPLESGSTLPRAVAGPGDPGAVPGGGDAGAPGHAGAGASGGRRALTGPVGGRC